MREIRGSLFLGESRKLQLILLEILLFFIRNPSWYLMLNLRWRFSLLPEAATTGACAASGVKANVVAILGPFVTQCLDISQELFVGPQVPFWRTW